MLVGVPDPFQDWDCDGVQVLIGAAGHAGDALGRAHKGSAALAYGEERYGGPIVVQVRTSSASDADPEEVSGWAARPVLPNGNGPDAVSVPEQ